MTTDLSLPSYQLDNNIQIKMAVVARRRNRDLVRRNAALVILPDRQNHSEHLSEGEVRDRFRFYPETIVYLTQTLRDDLERPTLRRSPLPV